MIAIDIKMPVNCEECFARILAWCRLDEEERMVIPALPDESFEGRPDWCPLVDVPDEAGNCSEIPNNSDSVSRQTAVDEIGKRAERCAERFGTDDSFWEGLMIAKNIVECAPSVQSEIIRCRDCAWSMTGDFSKKLFCSRTGALTWAEPDSFCSYAERKKDG